MEKKEIMEQETLPTTGHRFSVTTIPLHPLLADLYCCRMSGISARPNVRMMYTERNFWNRQRG